MKLPFVPSTFTSLNRISTICGLVLPRRVGHPSCLEATGSEIPVAYLKELADYWLNEYNWREYEHKLNMFPQFITDIDGQPIHFLHVRSLSQMLFH